MPSKRKITTTTEAPPVLSLLSQHSPFICAGIREDNPRDFLAALGFLRLLDSLDPSRNFQLSWSKSGSAILSWEGQASAEPSADILGFADAILSYSTLDERLVGGLKEHIRQEYSAPAFRPVRENIELSNVIFWPVPAAQKLIWNTDLIRVVFSSLRQNSNTPDSSTHEKILALQSRLVAALVSQVHVSEDKKQKCLKNNISGFSFANKQGQKYLLFGIQNLVRSVSKNHMNSWVGSEPIAECCESFRWNPAEYHPSAYESSSKDEVDFPLFNVLAFFGLTFYPVVDRAAREFTCGFSRCKRGDDNADCFTWPVWDAPLSVDTLSSLLLHPALHSEACDPFIFKSIGCQRVWSSRRFSADKSLYFSPAARVF